MAISADAESHHAYVVDDDQSFRESLVLLLRTAGWLATGFASVRSFTENMRSLPPGVLLLDIRLPHVGGLDLLETNDEQLANFAVVIISGHADVDCVLRSLKAGAVDFIEKPFDGQELLHLLESSYDRFLDRIDSTRRERDAQFRLSRLSRREVDVLGALLAGAPYKVIARHLGISCRTVEMYRNNLVRKLGVQTTAEALQLAVLANLKPTDLGQAARSLRQTSHITGNKLIH